MQLVYISGPYSAPTKEGVDENIARAKKYAEKYWALGYAVICPHMNSAHMDEVISWDEFLERDIFMISRCDIVVMMPGWIESKGARMEMEAAIEMKKALIMEGELE